MVWSFETYRKKSFSYNNFKLADSILEYCFSIPANRIGANYFSVAQLKIIQEVITLVVFAGFSVLYLKQEIKLNYLYAFICMIGAVYFMFKK